MTAGVSSRTRRLVIWLLVWWLRLWLWPLTRLLSIFRNRGPLPHVKKPQILNVSATKLADQIRKRQVKCVDVVLAYIERISDVRRPLNCVVEDRFKEALEEAAIVDKILEENSEPSHWLQIKPLLGVPVTVKESIAVKGLSHNAGKLNKEKHIAAEDAEAISKLREAGAIILLVSNTPELCMAYETFNKVTGKTSNPYDLRRTSGGSSGGEAALLGAGASVIGVGSDIAGSARLPALFCGVFGHKPTPGIVSTSGHIPSCRDEKFESFFTLAPMCRYAEDLPLLLTNLITDSNKLIALNLEKPVDIKKLKLYYMEGDGSFISSNVHKELKRGMRTAIKHFETKYGIVAKKLELTELKKIWEISVVLMMRMKGIDCVYSKSGADDPDEWKSVFKEFVKFFCGCSRHTLPALLFGPIRKYCFAKSDKTFEKMLQFKRDLMTKFEEILGDDGVFFYPMFYDMANFHYQFYYKLLNVGYFTIFNLLELPATACPIGLAKDGRPLGLQIAVNKNQDRLSFAVAKELEVCFGGWWPPPQSDPPLETA